MATALELMGLGTPGPAAAAIGGSDITSFTPAGTTQGTATALYAATSTLASATVGKGVLLPPASGQPVFAIYNGSGAAQKIYPATGEAVNAGAANIAINILDGQSVILVPAKNKWIAVYSA